MRSYWSDMNDMRSLLNVIGHCGDSQSIVLSIGIDNLKKYLVKSNILKMR